MYITDLIVVYSLLLLNHDYDIVPTKPETQGRTDAAVAQFLKGRKREDVILATKVSGRSDRITWLPRAKPETPAALTREQILYSVDESLKRLGVDYIDLIQLHWPGTVLWT